MEQLTLEQKNQKNQRVSRKNESLGYYEGFKGKIQPGSLKRLINKPFTLDKTSRTFNYI